MTGEGDDRPISRIHRHDGADALSQRIFGSLLDVEVDSQDERVPWRGRQGGQDPQGAALGVDLRLNLTALPPQYAVIHALYPILADEVAALVALRSSVLELAVVDLAQVSQDVRGQRPVGVLAHGLHL